MKVTHCRGRARHLWTDPILIFMLSKLFSNFFGRIYNCFTNLNYCNGFVRSRTIEFSFLSPMHCLAKTKIIRNRNRKRFIVAKQKWKRNKEPVVARRYISRYNLCASHRPTRIEWNEVVESWWDTMNDLGVIKSISFTPTTRFQIPITTIRISISRYTRGAFEDLNYL